VTNRIMLCMLWMRAWLVGCMTSGAAHSEPLLHTIPSAYSCSSACAARLSVLSGWTRGDSDTATSRAPCSDKRRRAGACSGQGYGNSCLAGHTWDGSRQGPRQPVLRSIGSGD